VKISDAGPGEIYVPDMSRRKAMNEILVGAIGVSTISLAIPYFIFFMPPVSDGFGGSSIAKDALGNDISTSGWKLSHTSSSRELVQGLNGDATYLILDDDRNLSNVAINAVCTHLGCVVPWDKAENKFICHCHGSQYNKEGKVIHGPAPLSLALVHCDENPDGKVVFRTWTEEDYRTGEAPW